MQRNLILRFCSIVFNILRVSKVFLRLVIIDLIRWTQIFTVKLNFADKHTSTENTLEIFIFFFSFITRTIL